MAKEKVKTKQAVIPQNIPFWQNDKVLAWIFFGLAFLLYAQTISYGYALDDRAVTFQNKFVMKGFGGIGSILKTFYWAGFWDSNAGLFRPVSLILFAIEWQLFHKGPLGELSTCTPHVFHLVNVVLYSISVFLLYKTLREIFREYSLTLPALVTLLWIVFPAHTEVVANIKSADELLSMIFFLLMMRQILRWSENGMMKPLLLSGLFFFLSLLSKEGAVLFLPIALLALYQFRKKEMKELIKPVLVLIGVTLVWFAWHAGVIANAPTKKITYSYHDNALFATNDVLSRIATAVEMQGKYLLKSFTGFPLSYDYSFNENPNTTFGDIAVLLSVLVCAGLFVVGIMRIKKDAVLSFGILFYFTTFALTSNIFVLIGATMADRFLFVPSLGFSIAIVWFILKITKGETVKLFHARAMYVLIPLAFFYSIRSFSRSQDWKDETTLFTTDVENAPGSARVHYNYGIVLKGQAGEQTDATLKSQLYNQALQEFQTAVKIDSADYQLYAAAGETEFLNGNYPSSVYWRKKTLEVEPKYTIMLRDLGASLMKCHRYDSALVVFQKAVEVNSFDSTTFIHIGDLYLLKKDTTMALKTFEDIAKRYPQYVDGWDKLANLSGMSGNFKRSNEAFLEITKLSPEDPKPYYMLFSNYLRMGDTATAITYRGEYQKRGGK